MAQAVFCDVVLEGGGVKGIGLVGALDILAQNGYQFKRVAGTSAGAIVGSLVAAGMPLADIISAMQTLDYLKFKDGDWLDKFGWPGEGLSLILTKGIYEGRYLYAWLTETLAKYGIRTFADLKLTEDWAQKLPPERRYKLMVVTSDISRGRMVRLPWDYSLYGLNPDEQLVADAVRASMSIPYFYQPAVLQGKYLVDGAILSNFPIDSFDDTTAWPTFGLKLSAHENAEIVSNPVTNPVNFTTAIFNTMMEAHDRMHLDEPSTQARTIFIDTMGVKTTDFNIKPAQQKALLASGRAAATKFLTTWDYTAYKQMFA